MDLDLDTDYEGMGYTVEALQHHLAAADAHIERLRARIDELRARPPSTPVDPADERGRIAARWLSAHVEAEAIRAEAARRVPATSGRTESG